MKKIYLISLVCLISITSFAKFVNYEDAKKVAIAHFYISNTMHEPSDLDSWELKCVANPNNRNSDFKFYAFDFINENSLAHILVSSNNSIRPILAYSFENNFQTHNISPAQKAFLQYFDKCIDYVSSRFNLPIDETVEEEWNYLLNFDFLKTRAETYTSPILLEGIEYNQTYPYNVSCPEDASASGNLQGRVPVGCVATATCQVMKYYNWPPRGQNSKTHLNAYNGGYGNITINFADEEYNWDQIPLKGSKYNNPELGKLGFHVGVSVGMSWGAEASGVSSISYVADAMKKYFRFDETTSYREKSNSSDFTWGNIIKSEIDAKRPVVYQGVDYNAESGHAWNCDGYQERTNGRTYFHMNWGWGGAGNAYYPLDSLVAPAVVGGNFLTFSGNQAIIYGIIPKPYVDNPYPNHFAGTHEIQGQEGSFDDGSGPENYMANTEAFYVIRPSSCGSVIQLKFDKFDLAENDELYLYYGEDDDKILKDKFTSINKPDNTFVYTGLDVITLRFVTNDIAGADGWTVSYFVSNCLGQNNVITKLNASLTDGSGENCNYKENTDCRWLINPEGANNIQIHVNKFDLADGDFLELFEGSSTVASNSIVKLTNQNLPDGSYFVNASSLAIRFKVKYNSPTANGWELSYVSNVNTINPGDILVSGLEIIPNPGNMHSLLKVSMAKRSELKISIVNVLGKSLATRDFFLDEGVHEFGIKDVTNLELENGIYFISLISENNILKTRKFVLVD